MSDMQRMTITLTPEMASMVRGAVGGGDYASSSEIVREALRDWRIKRLERERALTGMRDDIAQGLSDRDQGRVRDFDAYDIKKAGRQAFQGDASE